MIPYDDISTFFHGYIEQLSLSVDDIADVTGSAASLATQTIINEKKLIVCGVGPDAAGAGLLTELLQQGLYRERPAIPAIELTSRHITSLDPGVGWLTQQLTALGQPGDLAILYATSLTQVDLEFLSSAIAKRNLTSIWVGAQGTGPSLAFPGADRATALALSQCCSICLAKLIDISLFGTLEDNMYKRLFIILSLTYLTGCGTVLATFESNSIENEPGERSLAEQVLDESIETKAIVNIRAANAAFDDLGFLVVSYNGYVLIAGEVPDQGLKDEASNVVREIEGVRRIYNELAIGPKSTSGTEANDVWLTTKIKTALLTDSEVPSLRVKVVTENSVVYLMGLLSTEEANRTAAAAAEVDGVKRVVRLFELI